MIQPIGKTRAFLSGMAKAFDFGNSRRVFKRKRRESAGNLYGKEKTDMERLTEDWITIGDDMRIAIAKFGEQHGK